MSETEKSSRLEAARAGSHIRSTSNTLKNAKPSFKLLFYLQVLDLFFLVAFAAALLKDLLDLIGIGSLPAIGTVVTLMASTSIFAALFITGSTSKRKTLKGIWKSAWKKYGVVGATTIVEMLFGLNFIPFETFAVIIAFYLTLVERKNTAESQSESQTTVRASNVSSINSDRKTNNQKDLPNEYDYADAA
ncbi:MAG: hypothetical protein HGB08_04935 [Candidatus Moranbacteria bacterium]|nr:hypothetical protein [Candidatus Moranbacteria bacterium]